MEILFVFAKCFVALLVGWIVLEIFAKLFTGFARLDDREVDLWPVQRLHRHPTYTDEEILRPGFDVRSPKLRHAYYRGQIVPKAVQLHSKGWMAAALDYIMGYEAVEGEEVDNV